MLLTYFLICALIGLSITQAPPAMTPQQIAKMKTTMQKQCSKCKLCETPTNSIHPCESPLCKGTLPNFGPCKMCVQYPSCFMCNTVCMMLPMMAQIPPSFGK